MGAFRPAIIRPEDYYTPAPQPLPGAIQNLLLTLLQKKRDDEARAIREREVARREREDASEAARRNLLTQMDLRKIAQETLGGQRTADVENVKAMESESAVPVLASAQAPTAEGEGVGPPGQEEVAARLKESLGPVIGPALAKSLEALQPPAEGQPLVSGVQLPEMKEPVTGARVPGRRVPIRFREDVLAEEGRKRKEKIGEVEAEAEARARAEQKYPKPQAPHVVNGRLVSATGKVLFQEPNEANAVAASGLTGEAYLKTLPKPVADQIRAIGEGRQNIVQVASLRKGKGDQESERRKLSLMVTQAFPEWDANVWAQRNKAWKDYAGNGGPARNIRSINTAINHLDNLASASESLNQSQFRIFNKAWQQGLKETGDPRVDRFLTDADAVATEMAAALKGGSAAPTTVEIQEERKRLNPANSPQQLNAVIEEMASLLAGRLSPLTDEWETVMGKPPEKPFLRPKARKTLERLGLSKFFDLGSDVRVIGPIEAEQ